MKLQSLKFVFVLVMLGSCSRTKEYDPLQYFSIQECDSLVYQTLRYSAKLPPTATHENKFNSEYNNYYKSLTPAHELKYYYQNDSIVYFLITRQARSIVPMREAIGGKIQIDETGKLREYEEIFRTWKMPAGTLEIRGLKLFDALVKGKDLTKYYSKYQRDQYIEFPDDRFIFDKVKKQWHDKALDSLMVN